MPTRYVLLGTDEQGRAVLELQASWSGSRWTVESTHTLADWAEAWQRLGSRGEQPPQAPLTGVPFHRGLRERESVPLTNLPDIEDPNCPDGYQFLVDSSAVTDLTEGAPESLQIAQEGTREADCA